jgi:hypothetical protein
MRPTSAVGSDESTNHNLDGEKEANEKGSASLNLDCYVVNHRQPRITLNRLAFSLPTAWKPDRSSQTSCSGANLGCGLNCSEALDDGASARCAQKCDGSAPSTHGRVHAQHYTCRVRPASADEDV